MASTSLDIGWAVKQNISRILETFEFTPRNSKPLPLLYTFVALVLILLLYNKSNRKRATRGKTKKTTEIPEVSIFRSLIDFIWLQGDTLKLLEVLCNRYGNIFRRPIPLISDVVILSNPSMIQKLLSDGKSYVNKPSFIYHNFADKYLKQGLVASDYTTWKPHRAIISRAFTYESLKSYIEVIHKHSERLVSDIREDFIAKVNKDHEYANMNVTIHTCSTRIISHLVTGFDLPEDTECQHFHKNIIIAEEIITSSVLRPWLLLKPIWFLHPNRQKLEGVLSELKDFTKQILTRHRIEQVLQEKGTSASTTKHFKSILEQMLIAGMSDEEIFTETFTLIVAGHDAVSIALNFLLFSLALHPVHQEKCRNEVDRMFEEIENNTEKGITMEALQNLNYLERCIKESLRLFPSLPLYARRLEEPLQFDNNDIVLQKGVVVGVPAILVHRNPEYFPNPEKFDPDRFLPEACKTRHPYSFLAFSGGPRNCIGWKLALVQLKIMCGHILRNFDLETTDKMENVKLLFKLSLTTEKEINFIIKERQK